MDQNSGTGGMSNNGQGSDDPSRAREHVRAAEENRDALEAQNRRTEATTPGDVSTTGNHGGMDVSGNRGALGGGPGSMNAGTGQTASDDPSQAREHIRAAEENRDALAEESRRIQGSAPDDISTGR